MTPSDSAQLKCAGEIFLGTVLTVFRTWMTTAITTLCCGPISTRLTAWPWTNWKRLLDSCAEPDGAASDCFYGVISTAGSDRPVHVVTLAWVRTVCLSAIKFRVVAGMFYGVRARAHGTLLLTYVHFKLWRWFIFHARSSPLIVGCAGGCTREVIEDTNFMHEAAADFA